MLHSAEELSTWCLAETTWQFAVHSIWSDTSKGTEWPSSGWSYGSDF